MSDIREQDEMSEEVQPEESVGISEEFQNQVYLNVEEAARFLKCKKVSVYQDCKRGTIPFIKRSRYYFFKREDLITWMDGMRCGIIVENNSPGEPA